MDKFLNNKNMKDKYIEIRNFYVGKKYKSVIKSATNYLKYCPNDINIRFMRAKSFRYLNMFDESIKDLKYNLSIAHNDHSLTQLYYNYYYLNMYEEALQLLPILYDKKCIKPYSLAISELVMKKALGINVIVKQGTRCDYIRNQINNYSEEEAIKHINKHLEKNDLNDDKSYFQKNINLDYLISVVKENLKHNKKVNTEEILEIHYFGISNIGYDKNNNYCNYIKVVVIPNTTNIISIYPINDVDTNEISAFQYDYSKMFYQTKVKKISQIDKFNNRYNK